MFACTPNPVSLLVGPLVGESEKAVAKMKSNDPAYWMSSDGVETTTNVFNKHCYICNDPEFAQMGLPLCYACLVCGAHVAADDGVCDNGHDQPECPHYELEIRKAHNLEIPLDMQELQKYIGERNGEQCPECSADLLEDRMGTKWCSFVDCYWSNEPSFSAWVRALGG